MIDFAALKSGQTIQLNDDRTGIVRYTGLTHFAPKEWVGIELEDPSGKNDGSVQGERYFDSEPNHGMFLRVSGIARILEEPTPKPTKPATGTTKTAASSATAGKARAGGSTTATANGVRRQSTMDPAASKRQSINAASPTPTLRRQTLAPPNGIKGPARPAAKAVGSTATSSAASSRGPTPSLTRKPPTTTDRTTTSRPSLAQPASRPSATTTKSQSPTSSASSSRPRPLLAPPAAGRPRTTTKNSSAASKPASVPSSRPSYGPSAEGPSQSNGVSRLHPQQQSQSSIPSQTEDDEDDDVSVSDSTASNIPQDDVSPSQHAESSEVEESVEDELDVSQDHADDASVEEPVHAEPKPQQPKKPPDDRPPPKPGSRVTTQGRKIEELEAQIKILERKRDEDKERLSRFENLQAEKDKYEKIIQSLQTKYGPQTQELHSLRARLKEVESNRETIENLKLEHENDMELATLDREMAEETVESLRTELDAIKQKTEELELEVEVLREENSELGKEMSPEERTTQGWLQIERSNERLREALYRLREMSQEREAELNEHIAEKDQSLQQLQGIEDQHRLAKEQFERSEAAVEDLKQQLEAALTAEEMVEELMETNNNLNDQISQLRAEMEDLQTINELNDEFEQQHQESEKQMQEELDTRAAALAEQTARAALQDEKLNDYEYTIAKFRDLVNSLQTHLEDMKASQQITEAEAEELDSRAKAMTDLNLKLRSSAAKTQVNTIDLEIRRMEAQEAAEHLNIVQMFLPDAYKSERKSVLAYLKFKRVSFKANLLQSLLRDKLSSSSDAPDSLFVLCELVDKLAWLSAMCTRLSSDMARCEIDRFARYEGSLQDLDPIERALTAYTVAWKKDELRVEQAVEELDRSMAVLRHLSEVQLESEDLAIHADKLIMQSSLSQSCLETAASAFSCSRLLTSSASPKTDGVDHDRGEEEEADDVDNYLDELDNAISQTRNTKVIAGKILTSVSDYHSRTMTLDPNASNEAFSEALELTATFSRHAQTLGDHLTALTSPTEDDSSPFATRLRTAFSTFHYIQYPNITKPTSPLQGLAEHLKRIYNHLTNLSKRTSDITSYVEYTTNPPPWIIRAQEIKSSTLHNAATEAELARLKEVMQDRLSQLRLKDQKLEEQDVKIELLESRTKEAGERTRAVEEMRKKLEVGRKREAELSKALEDVGRQVEELKREREGMRRVVEERNAMNDGDDTGNFERGVASKREMEMMQLEIKSLKGAVRFLNEGGRDAGREREERDKELAWLKEPLFSSKTPQAKAVAVSGEMLRREGNDVLDRLLDMAMTTPLVDLKRLSENKLAWRPAKQKNSWLVAWQEEDWARWHGQMGHVVEKARQHRKV